jgi:hypothetical protein
MELVLPDCPEELLPDWLESWANADIEAVKISANASVNTFFMKRHFLFVLTMELASGDFLVNPVGSG